ncbi:hypothetical protein ACFQ0T_17420 [Kitasatospora gansuensis]
MKISSAKVWQSKFVSGDIGSFSLFPTNVSVPITSLVMTDPGTDTTTDLYNWLAPQSIQLEAWNPTSIGLTFEYRLNGDPAWQTFTPGTPFNGAAARRLTFATGAGDPANDIVGIPAAAGCTACGSAGPDRSRPAGARAARSRCWPRCCTPVTTVPPRPPRCTTA